MLNFLEYPHPLLKVPLTGRVVRVVWCSLGGKCNLMECLGWASQLGLWYLSHINRAPSCILRPVFWQIFLSRLSFYKMWFHLDTSFPISVVNFICLQCTTWWPTWHVFLPKKTGTCGTQLSKMASWIAKPWIEQALMSETGKDLPKIARAQILKVGKTFLWTVGSNVSQTSMDQETTNSAKFKN